MVRKMVYETTLKCLRHLDFLVVGRYPKLQGEAVVLHDRGSLVTFKTQQTPKRDGKIEVKSLKMEGTRRVLTRSRLRILFKDEGIVRITKKKGPA